MSNTDFHTSFTVDAAPAAVFAAINDVRGWWSGDIEGVTDAPGAVFTYRYKDMHRSSHRIVEFEPARKIVWHVSDAVLNFVADKTEWNGTDIVFDLEPVKGGTRLTFTHVGLTPTRECYGACSGAWTHYIVDSLRGLIARGEGQPDPKAG
jgi:hypothetical protein